MDNFVHKNQKKMRRGLTTGTCAAACTKAAMRQLLRGVTSDEVALKLPGGEMVSLKVMESVDQYSDDSLSARFYTIKDSGDDPDVTNGTEIHVLVSVVSPEEVPKKAFKCDSDDRLFLQGGQGVGTVTKEGLWQEVGQSAINPVPREMIFDAALDVLDESELEEHRDIYLITVIVPAGEELSRRTFNPRLGIEGGISILGTTGIVEPMSEAAIVSTIETEIKQKLALDDTGRILVVPGNYGKRYAEGLKLDLRRSVEVSNYIGEAIDLSVSYGCREFLLVGNIGKLIKLAAGIMNTYSRVADGRWEIMAAHLALCGGANADIRRIREAPTTEEMLRILDEIGLREKTMESIMSEIEYHMDHRIHGQMEFGVVVFSERFGLIGKTQNAGKLVKNFRDKL